MVNGVVGVIIGLIGVLFIVIGADQGHEIAGTIVGGICFILMVKLNLE